MRTLRFLCCLTTITLAAVAHADPVTIEPVFVPDQLIISLAHNPPGVTPGPSQGVEAELYDAAGVEFVRTIGSGPAQLVQLKPGMTFGRAFRAVQRFSFEAYPNWSLEYVQPNGYGWAGVIVPPIVSRVFNFSARAHAGPGSSVTIGGLVVPGEIPRLVVFKVRGPSLAAFGVDGALADPQLQLFDGATMTLSNDDWADLRGWERQLASQLCPPPDDPREAMIVTYLDPGVYSAIVRGANGGTGIVLLEMYLLDQFLVR